MLHVISSLRHDWENLPLYGWRQKEMMRLQQDCSNKRRTAYAINNYGMGSGLVSLSQAFCHSLEHKDTIQIGSTDWIWYDTEFCSGDVTNSSKVHQYIGGLDCYFGHVVQSCSWKDGASPAAWMRLDCPKVGAHPWEYEKRVDFYGDFFNYLFSRVNPRLIALANKAAMHTFGSEGSPKDMITVHIRWGDKKQELHGLVEIEEYIKAVESLIKKHQLTTVHIFLNTIDGRAIDAWNENVKEKNWKTYIWNDSVESMSSYDNNPTTDARRTKGAFGTTTMVALLLAMESRFYVITSGSNYSMLIEALRRGVLDKECTGCTDVIDLKHNPLQIKVMKAHNVPIPADWWDAQAHEKKV